MELDLDINVKAQLTNGDIKREVHEINEHLLRGLVTGWGVCQFTTIFAQPLVCYFQHTSTSLEQFTYQEVPDGIVTDINNHINEMTEWVKQRYLTSKSDGTSATELISMMRATLQTVDQKMALLKDPSFSKNALSVFALEGSMHLMMLQEIALLDGRRETSETLFSDEIRDVAEEYSAHINTTWLQLLAARVKAISAVSLDMMTDISEGPYTSLAKVRWDDDVVGKHYLRVTKKDKDGNWDKGDPSDLVDEAKMTKAAHANDAIDHMDVSMVSGPLQAIIVWNMLRRPLVLR